MKRFVHIVWAPNVGPIVAYTKPDAAHAHACTMSGVDVTTVELSERLPEVVLDDLSVEWEGDDDTPQVVDVDVDDIE